MSTELTPEGQQASQITDWAWQDPGPRVAEARRRLDALAESADGQALAEIQDAARMLARLAGTLEPSDTISSQLQR